MLHLMLLNECYCIISVSCVTMKVFGVCVKETVRLLNKLLFKSCL